MSGGCCGNSGSGLFGPEGKLFVTSGFVLLVGVFLINEAHLPSWGFVVAMIACVGFLVSSLWTLIKNSRSNDRDGTNH